MLCHFSVINENKKVRERFLISRALFILFIFYEQSYSLISPNNVMYFLMKKICSTVLHSINPIFKTLGCKISLIYVASHKSEHCGLFKDRTLCLFLRQLSSWEYLCSAEIYALYWNYILLNLKLFPCSLLTFLFKNWFFHIKTGKISRSTSCLWWCKVFVFF